MGLLAQKEYLCYTSDCWFIEPGSTWNKWKHLPFMTSSFLFFKKNHIAMYLEDTENTDTEKYHFTQVSNQM